MELRENHLKTLPKSMGRLIELRRLDIGQNDFIEFPDVIGSLISLTEFWCDYNKLLILPDVSWLVIHGFMGRFETNPILCFHLLSSRLAI